MTDKTIPLTLRTLTSVIFGIFALMGAEIAVAQCPNGLFYADLSRNQRANFLLDHVTDVDIAPNSNSECSTSHTLRLTIDIPEECSQAVVWVQFEGTPSGWTLNLGDSSTNNGFGGGAPGTTSNNAELQILDQNLAVYTAAAAPEELDRLLFQEMMLTDGALNFVVENQAVSWGQSASVLQSSNQGRLFAIPDNIDDGRRVYLGLNRVVANASRNGCGARRVMISFR